MLKNGLKYAKDNNYDVVIVDTAGRLTIDEDMMQELKVKIKEIIIDGTSPVDDQIGTDLTGSLEIYQIGRNMSKSRTSSYNLIHQTVIWLP